MKTQMIKARKAVVRHMATLLAGLCCVATVHAADFTVESPDFAPWTTLKHAHIFNGFGCTGGNTSPALMWKNPPAGTLSYAITAYDPDAPTGSGWWHWVLINLPPTLMGLPTGAGNGNALPKGAVQTPTDFGTAGYGGPCPPLGDKQHRYIFTVYALKVDKIDVPPNASGAMVGYFLNANALGTATITGYYGRQSR